MIPFGFREQLKIGLEGEKLFLQLYHQFYLINNEKNNRLPDFIHRKTGALVEVKYDDSNRAILDENGKQLNLFIEKYSDYGHKTLGGPFRAVKEKCDYYVYIFKKPCRIFLMDASLLAEKADLLIQSNVYPAKIIPNRNYNTLGYALPISEFMSCVVAEEEFQSGKKRKKINIQ